MRGVSWSQDPGFAPELWAEMISATQPSVLIDVYHPLFPCLCHDQDDVTRIECSDKTKAVCWRRVVFMKSRTGIKAAWSQRPHWTFPLFVSQSTWVCFHLQMRSICWVWARCPHYTIPTIWKRHWPRFSFKTLKLHVSGKHKDKENGVDRDGFCCKMDVASAQIRWQTDWSPERWLRLNRNPPPPPHSWLITLSVCVGPEYRHRKHLSPPSERVLLEEGRAKSPR